MRELSLLIRGDRGQFSSRKSRFKREKTRHARREETKRETTSTRNAADDYIYLKLLTQAICAGAVCGSTGHIGYKYQIWDVYDIIIDTSLALCCLIFWVHIDPTLDDFFQDEGTAIAFIQFLRALTGVASLLSAVYDNTKVAVTILSAIFVMIDPFFPKAVPIIARITKRQTQILVLPAFIACGVCSAGVASLCYRYFGSVAGLCLQTAMFLLAMICAFALPNEIQSESEEQSPDFDPMHFSHIFLWFCVFPAGGNN